ncbi:FAD-dependent oxidoreductase [Bradyrhizobium sp. GCM10028915]
MTTPDTFCVSVIGAGITGITTAYHLARRGCRATVFGR